MSRDISVQYRSPQQLPQSRKPNVENIPPQRNTNEFIKQMKKRIDEPPLSIVSQNSQIQEAKSIIIDMSRIDQQSNNSQNSFYDPQQLRQPILPYCHKSNQPSNCTTQRTNRYDQPRNSKPYLDQSDNASMLFFQQQMLSLQNENLILKQQLEKQESQRMLFQQQLLQQFQSQQNQQPIVINNNIAPHEKPSSKSIPPQIQEESYSPPKRIKRKKQQSQAIQTEKSLQEDQSITKVNDSKFQNCALTDFSNQQNQSKQQQCLESQKQQSVESLTFGTQLSQRNIPSPQYDKQKSTTQHVQESQISPTMDEDKIFKEGSKSIFEKQKQRKYSQFEVSNTENQSFQQSINESNSQNLEIRKQSQPSVRLEFNFDETSAKKQQTLADCFLQRKKNTIQERKVSVQSPIPEGDENWIVNVKQRSKEEQLKLRKEMMEYGRNRRQQNGANKSQNPIEEANSNQKEGIKRVQSPLMERLALGQKAKVEVKEMFALTKKNYENLPEVKNKKSQEEMQKQKQTFMKERLNKLKELDEKIKEKMKK